MWVSDLWKHPSLAILCQTGFHLFCRKLGEYLDLLPWVGVCSGLQSWLALTVQLDSHSWFTAYAEVYTRSSKIVRKPVRGGLHPSRGCYLDLLKELDQVLLRGHGFGGLLSLGQGLGKRDLGWFL